MSDTNVSTNDVPAAKEFFFPLEAGDSSSVMVRVTGSPDAPMFCAADVCTVLGIANSRDALLKLDDDEKGVGNTDTLGGTQQMQFVTESGLYHLVFKSRKPAAKRFRRWVTGTVLPALRRGESVCLGDAPEPTDDDLFSMPEWLKMVKLDPQKQMEACASMFRAVDKAAKYLRYVHASKMPADGYQRYPLAVLKYAAAIFVKEAQMRQVNEQTYAVRVVEGGVA